MIRDTNKRVTITLSKKQDEWLGAFSKQLRITKSQAVKWLISKNVELLIEYIYRKENDLTNEEIQRIIHTKWLDD